MALIKTETYFYELDGEPTVSVAAQLINKLPNAWTLLDLSYSHSLRQWRAKVQGPAVVQD